MVGRVLRAARAETELILTYAFPVCAYHVRLCLGSLSHCSKAVWQCNAVRVHDVCEITGDHALMIE
eukprot:4154626-Pleurochrysis_carterae.AAC.1